MSFSTAISGLSAAANLLSVTGNNVANANTTGFKESRSEFQDIYAHTFQDIVATSPGMGVRIADVAQQFHQGTLDYTNNNLDIAINGEGFFTLGSNLANTTTQVYSRNGAFHANQDGFVVNTNNQPLMVYAPKGKTVAEGFGNTLQALQIDTSQGAPQATSKLQLGVNLNSNSTPPVDTATGTALAFTPTDSKTFNWSSSVTTYDSLGNPHTLTNYFVKTATAGPWNMYSYFDGKNPTTGDTTVPTASQVTFNTSGALDTTTPSPLTIAPAAALTPGANAMSINLDLTGSTQLATTSNVNSLSQDGLPVGNLTGISVDKTGIVTANYSNGLAKPLGQVALTRFINPQGLEKLGDTQWRQTVASGEPISGAAGLNGFGAVNSGALEQSNVDIAQQLIKLITAQQSYQANAQSITTENQAIQSILNIR